MSPIKQKINLDFKGSHSIAELLGDGDKLIKIIEKKYNVSVVSIVTLIDLIEYLKEEEGQQQTLDKILAYLEYSYFVPSRIPLQTNLQPRTRRKNYLSVFEYQIFRQLIGAPF